MRRRAGIPTVSLFRRARIASVLPCVIVQILLTGGCQGSEVGSNAATGLVVYAASSLTDVLEEMSPVWEAATGIRITLNLGGSGALARQIVAARRADIFISADEIWMDLIEREGLILEGTRRPLLSNRLVVVVPVRAELVISGSADLAGDMVRRIAVANPDAVPAGRYARDWLRAEGVWDRIEPRVVPAVDVRAALATVASGLVDAGIVYRTDARVDRGTRIAFEVAGARAPEIIYPAAVMTSDADDVVSLSRTARAARALDWLEGPEGRALFEKHGFVVLEPAPRVVTR